PHGVEVLAGGHEAGHLDGAALVVTSPGVPEHAPILQEATARGIPIWSELELGARLCDAPYVAITGTNGKTTTTEMVAGAMRAAGLDAVACGNVGYPFSLAAGEGHDALAVEASSFQLRFHERFHPRVSILLNVAPDHLDWHGSMEAYGQAKARVFSLQRAGDIHVGNGDDAAAAAISASAPCPVVWFRLVGPAEGEVGYRDDGVLVSRLGGDAVELGTPRGESEAFRADAAAAAAASLAFGLDPDAVRRALASFQPLRHRGEVVATVGSVRFVDNSKATNPHAALAALAGLERAVLVAGGLSRGLDLSPLTAALPALAGVVVLGETGPEIAALFEGSVPVQKAGSIEEAVTLGIELAPPGGVVILAPACASQDMFRDYAERGDRFAAAARALRPERPHAPAGLQAPNQEGV
ncbi:MAG: UDP-N-acetylmuramoyl-L-alanine--D-glutamate ligase, partial [Actinomycetota bacterium]|nr:UDP-N-acetylmuramoyl-L-alanine--D-glutamate ligase [Actinomycetota bacterium]